MREALKWGLLNYGWPVARLMLAARPGMSLSKFSAAHIRPGDRILDIGAHKGVTASFFACCVGPQGHVHAIEPNPALRGFLENAKARSRWPNISLHYVALSDVAGDLEFFADIGPTAMASTLSQEHVQREAKTHGATFTSIKVPALTLDQFCAAKRIIPNLIKIDVEGTEDAVIRGGMDTIRNHRPVVWFECWCGYENGQPINSRLAHIRTLQELGYRLFVASVIEKGGRFILQEDAENVRDLVPLTDDILRGPTTAIDVAAIP